ncbi:MAG TPA: G1 family glutamic endopeptidase [Chlamydiales bacterium]|nr:G1 family glutamic endopeptidase [Chlamydiales bacterium]
MRLILVLAIWLGAAALHSIEIECTLRAVDRTKIHPKRTAPPANEAISSNWSGYVAAPSLQRSVVGSVSYVAGAWVVPTILPTPDTSYSAIWVGIDGYLSGSVEQIGTSHNWVNGAQQNYAWFEMYPSGAYMLVGFPVDVGDFMSARVGYKGNDVYKLVIFNHTKGVSFVIPAQYTTSPNLDRSSAEWVIEAPFSNTVLPLADFNLATFNYCSAFIDGIGGTISDGHWVNDFIVMEDQNGIKAQPAVLLKNGTCFITTWKHE